MLSAQTRTLPTLQSEFAGRAIEFHEFERQGWQEAAEKYQNLWGTLTAKAVQPMLDVLDVKAGGELLDVACGPGYVAAAAARRGASATGIDFSDVMVRLARGTHPECTFQTANAEDMPFADGRFSAVAFNYGLHHLDNPMQVLREAGRILQRGGRIAFTVWATTDRTKGASIVYTALKQHGTFDVALPPAPPFWRLDTAGEARDVLRAAGFVDATATVLAQNWRLPSPDHFFRAFYDGAVRTKALLRAQTPQALIAIRRTIEQALKAYMRNGYIEIPMAAVLVSGKNAGIVH